MIIWDTAVRSARWLARWRARPPAGPFHRIDFVIVDVETTGWTPQEGAITEIGAVRVSGGRVSGQFCSLVNPGAAIPASVSALTGIEDPMVAAAPRLCDVLPEFLAFAQDCVLTAHNAPFDIGFLTAACQACDLPWPGYEVLDTVTLARLVLGEDEVPDRKLTTLAEFFGAQTPPCHRALPDALATADVLTGLLHRLAATGVSSLASDGDGNRLTSFCCPVPAAPRAGPRPSPACAVRYRPPGTGTAGPLAAVGGFRHRPAVPAGERHPDPRQARGGRCGHRDRPDPG